MNTNELIEILKKQHYQYRQKLKEKIEYYGCHVISVNEFDEYDFSFPEPDNSYEAEDASPIEEYDYSFPDDEPLSAPKPTPKEAHQKNVKELIDRIALLRGGPLQGGYLKRPKKN